jgi:hypothetical protein
LISQMNKYFTGVLESAPYKDLKVTRDQITRLTST